MHHDRVDVCVAPSSHILYLAALLLVAAPACLDQTVPEPPPGSLGGGVSTSNPADGGRRCAGSIDRNDEDLLLHFIDVGQGDAIWIQTPDDGDDGNGEREGLNLLIDTGRIALDDVPGTGSVVVNYMVQHGLPIGGTIDFMFITHAHSDHYGGAIEVLDAFNVRAIADPGYTNSENSTYLRFLEKADEEITANSGQLLRPFVGTFVGTEYEHVDVFGDELDVQILNSEQDLRLGSSDNIRINNTSIAFSLEFAGRTALLTGDLGEAVEAELVATVGDLRANVLKVGHHGSSSSSSYGFLDHIFTDVPESQRIAVIMSGRRSFGGSTLPAQSTVDRLLGYVAEDSLFSTQNGDENRSESAAAGDDHIQVIIRADGEIESCYVP